MFQASTLFQPRLVLSRLTMVQETAAQFQVIENSPGRAITGSSVISKKFLFWLFLSKETIEIFFSFLKIYLIQKIFCFS